MSEASSTPTACSSSSSKYTHFTAKDSDSDSEVEEPGSGNPDDLEVVNSSKLTAVPDRNGVRFCRVCNEFLPIYAFPTGQRRYTCKTHLWMRVGIKAQKKLLAKPGKKLLSCNMEQLLQGRATSGPVSGSGCAGSVTDVDAKTLGLCSTPGRPSSRRDRSYLFKGINAQLIKGINAEPPRSQLGA